MPIIRPASELALKRNHYPLLLRAQKAIAGYRHYNNGDLSKYLDRDVFQTMANKLTDQYFHQSVNLAISEQVTDLFLVHLVMAPVIQRLPLSAKYDWHRGHLVSFFRRNANGKVKRYCAGVREIARDYDPELLAANLEQLGIHDGGMVAVLQDLYRRHAGGKALKDQLAHQLFDPILLMNRKAGYELRHGNRLYRMEKEPYDGSVDLRREALDVLDFRLQSFQHESGWHMEVMIAEQTLQRFRESVKEILALTATPKYKVQQIERIIRDLVERTRPARSGLPQIHELKQWLATKLRPLAGTIVAANVLPNLLVNHWLVRSDYRLHQKVPNFFLNQTMYREKTYMTFFSPYREL